MSPVETDVDRRLRSGLQTWQDAIPPAPAGFPVMLRERYRRRQRARRSAVGAFAAAAAAVVTVVVGVRGMGGVAEAPEPAAPVDGAPIERTDLVDLPTRGSLAGDAAWVAGVRDLDWPAADARDVPRPADRTVVLADDVPGGRVALVLGEVGNRTLRMWFTGPDDAAPGDLRPAVEAADVLPDRPLALWEMLGDGTDDGVLVVVAHPGDTATYTPGRLPLIEGGSVEQQVPLELVDGIGSATTPRPIRHAESLGVGIGYPGGEDGTGLAPDIGARAARELGLPLLDDPRGLRGDVPREWVRQALEDLTLRPGLGGDGQRVTLVLAGAVRDAERRSAVLLVATAPDGVTTALLWDVTSEWPVTATDAQRGLGGWGGVDTVTRPLPGTAGPLDRVLAIAHDGALTVSAPVTTGTVRLLDAAGDELASLPLDRGGVSSVVPDGGARVQVLDASGEVVAEQPLTDVFD